MKYWQTILILALILFIEKKCMVLIGPNTHGNILFIFCRPPYRVHDFIEMLLGLPIDLKRLMYLEGGQEASFYLNHSSLAIEAYGSYETGFNENNKRVLELLA